MWTPCSPILDEPVMVLFWEFRDFQIITMAPFGMYWLLGPFWAFGSGIAFAAITYWFKRGKPAGALQHLLHSWEFWMRPGGLLPGVLSPYPQRYSAW